MAQKVQKHHPPTTHPPPISLATAWIDITICRMMCAMGGWGGVGRSGKVQSQNQGP